MVKADGCRSNKLHLAAFQQLTVTTGTGTDYQCVSIPYISGGEPTAGQIHHFIGYLFNSLPNIGYFIIYNYFHL